MHFTNRQARWLQLFRLVEKQCQEQIIAQQEQFHSQIQLIQAEIKHLVTLQSGNSPRDTSIGVSSNKCTNNSSSLENQTDRHSEAFENKGGNTSQLGSLNEMEKQPRMFIMQQSFVDTTSLSSGYNTISATEPCDHSVSKQNMGCTEFTLSELDGIPLFQKAPAQIQNKIESKPVIEGNCVDLRTDEPHDFHFSQEKQEQGFDSDHNQVNKNHSGKMHNKSLTSWAQKMKQNQLKKAKLVEERCTAFMQGNDQTEKLAFDNSRSIEAFPSYNFYLRTTNDSPASVVSGDSGFTYWKLNEREMYQPLPEHFENVFSKQQFTNATTKQPVSSDKRKPSSLKEIYNRKQKESIELDDWSSPSQSYHHPPEVLTLDPTLHKKPSQQNTELPLYPFNALGSNFPITPDSLLKPLSDTASFSYNSEVNSPLLDDSSTYSKSEMLHLEPWNNHIFQNQTTATYSFPVPVSESGTETLIQMDDEENSNMSSVVAQSELPCADRDLPDYGASLTPLEHPLMLSRIRQSLREKYARHIADLKDYYEAEIHNLKHQFDTNMLSASEELKKTNQSLLDSDQLERALTEASTRMQTLENNNSLLEIQVKDWKERFNSVSNTSKVLHERIEEMRTSNKEKDNTISRLKSKLRDVEAALQQSCKLSDDKDDRIKQECKMFQNLLMEYESLGKEHERVKDTLNTAENKLLDADSEISELKRMVSKLEIQVKQVEHENITRLRQIAESTLWTSNSKTYRPEVLQSPSKLRAADVARRKWLIPGTEYSIFTGQPLESQVNIKDNRFEDAHALNRYHTPPEKELSHESFPRNEMKNKDKEMPDVPVMKALKELERKKVFKSWGTQTEKEDSSNKLLNRRQIGFVESVCSTSEVAEKRRDQQKPKRFNSSCSQRSSSLPPSGRKSTPTATPTKREIMLTPVSMKHSPKRSPKENFSPGFNQVLSKEKNSMARFDIVLDDLKTSPTSQGHSPRKRLQFLSLDTGDNQCSDSETAPLGLKNGSMIGGPALENHSAESTYDQYVPVSLAPYDTEFSYRTRLKTLAETEKVFDELIQEKQRIEAVLNRMPCSGGRLTLQTRLNREALEDRLEGINRDLGSIRMMLKKFHVLRTSANL